MLVFILFIVYNQIGDFMINLLYACNDLFFKGVTLSILSIIKHTKEPIHLYLLSIDLIDLNPNFKLVKQEKIDCLEKLMKQVNKVSKITMIDAKEVYEQKIIDKKIEKNKYSPYAFLRLLSSNFDVLPDKLLYLDSDIMALKNISDLFNINIDDYDYAMARDQVGKFYFSKDYCNSGVLLLNMKRLRENNILDKCIDYILSHFLSAMPDQNALNKISDNILVIDNKYNEQLKINPNTVLYHFNQKTQYLPYIKFINVKQWEVEKVHEILKIHEFDDIFEEYNKIKNLIES